MKRLDLVIGQSNSSSVFEIAVGCRDENRLASSLRLEEGGGAGGYGLLQSIDWPIYYSERGAIVWGTAGIAKLRFESVLTLFPGLHIRYRSLYNRINLWIVKAAIYYSERGAIFRGADGIAKLRFELAIFDVLTLFPPRFAAKDDT
jgi:hypothetical protein